MSAYFLIQPKKNVFDIILYISSFLQEIAEIRKFVHFISILAWFCINFSSYLFLIMKIVKF